MAIAALTRLPVVVTGLCVAEALVDDGPRQFHVKV